MTANEVRKIERSTDPIHQRKKNLSHNRYPKTSVQISVSKQ